MAQTPAQKRANQRNRRKKTRWHQIGIKLAEEAGMSLDEFMDAIEAGKMTVDAMIQIEASESPQLTP